jgi:hypothetical protein
MARWLNRDHKYESPPPGEPQPIHGTRSRWGHPLTVIIDGRRLRITRYPEHWQISDHEEKRLVGYGWRVLLEDGRSVILKSEVAFGRWSAWLG